MFRLIGVALLNKCSSFERSCYVIHQQINTVMNYHIAYFDAHITQTNNFQRRVQKRIQLFHPAPHTACFGRVIIRVWTMVRGQHWDDTKNMINNVSCLEIKLNSHIILLSKSSYLTENKKTIFFFWICGGMWSLTSKATLSLSRRDLVS